MRGTRNWLTISVIANALLGGLLAGVLSESEVIGSTVMGAVFLFAIIMTTLANRKTIQEQKRYEESLAPSIRKPE